LISKNSICRRGSLDRKDKRSSWAASESDLTAGLDNFPPVTLTVSSFFKQEADKLKDEDLYKHLQVVRLQKIYNPIETSGSPLWRHRSRAE
jgi:hypothetical protein